jgi:hypothetical protein
MGLDAVVFKNVKALEQLHGSGKFEVDAATGEAQPTAKASLSLTFDDVCAAQARLGNVAEIDHLRNLVGKVFGTAASIVTERVLYSGSHSGDVIGVEYISQLKEELCQLKASPENGLSEFIEKMVALSAAMESEHNPIVFT